jgi:hypothetical protein
LRQHSVGSVPGERFVAKRVRAAPIGYSTSRTERLEKRSQHCGYNGPSFRSQTLMWFLKHALTFQRIPHAERLPESACVSIGKMRRCASSSRAQRTRRDGERQTTALPLPWRIANTLRSGQKDAARRIAGPARRCHPLSAQFTLQSGCVNQRVLELLPSWLGIARSPADHQSPSDFER